MIIQFVEIYITKYIYCKCIFNYYGFHYLLFKISLFLCFFLNVDSIFNKNELFYLSKYTENSKHFAKVTDLYMH